jgi:hypothetical protein
MFCEMLGQTCYPEFFHNIHGYQEAFVVFLRHASVTIYYSKLPNLYLSEISEWGKKWHNHPQRTFNPQRNRKEKVKLYRTQTWSLTNTTDRVELFILLAKLFWYLCSGNAHVGYLLNYPDNPIHRIVTPVVLELNVGTKSI